VYLLSLRARLADAVGAAVRRLGYGSGPTTL
jgi:hypothetical protein